MSKLAFQNFWLYSLVIPLNLHCPPSKNAISGRGGGGQQPFLQEITKLLIAKKLVKICSIIYFISYLKWIIWKLFIFKQYWLSIFVPGSRIGFKLFYSAKMAKSHCEIYSCNFFHYFCSLIFREFRFVVIKFRENFWFHGFHSRNQQLLKKKLFFWNILSR